MTVLMQNIFLGLYSLNTEGQLISSIEADVESIPMKDEKQILHYFRIVFPKYQQTPAVALKQA